jgi:hypothetical protein
MMVGNSDTEIMFDVSLRLLKHTPCWLTCSRDAVDQRYRCDAGGRWPNAGDASRDE